MFSIFFLLSSRSMYLFLVIKITLEYFFSCFSLFLSRFFIFLLPLHLRSLSMKENYCFQSLSLSMHPFYYFHWGYVISSHHPFVCVSFSLFCLSYIFAVSISIPVTAISPFLFHSSELPVNSEVFYFFFYCLFSWAFPSS